ncbi:hypothetical protein ACIBL3_45345 [Kribbella sp. NPDC050124]|uniref:hypothetical protein n=1 Tax=Kribbella sp. NPDC050124 TaxID=3364114 RepID=UPI003792E423
MGEGRWVEVRVVGAGDGKGVKVVQQLRRELAEQEFMTQAGVGDAPELAVALSGADVAALVDVLKSWICRRHGPGTVRLTVGSESIDVDKPTFDERVMEGFLNGS